MLPITNCYQESLKTRKKIPSDRVLLYAPEGDWAYNHHASITRFNDRFVAQWSNGHIDEDDIGQRVLICHADDFHQWEAARPLLPTRVGKKHEVTMTAVGFHAHQGLLNTYFGQYEYLEPPAWPEKMARVDTRLYAMTSADGITFGESVDLGVALIANLGPQPLRSGRHIICGNVLHPYTDDPAVLTGFVPSGPYELTIEDGLTDQSMLFRNVAKKMGWAQPLCEGSFYQTDDGALHMLYRSSEKRLWLSESYDDGETWTQPEPTDFTDNNTKFKFGHLPDGRFYYVGSPDPEGSRNPLVVALSEDGVRFDRHFIVRDEPYEMRIPGLHKGGVYGYPNTYVDDESMYIIYSVMKENVEVSRVPLSELG